MNDSKVREGSVLQHFWRSPWTIWVGFRYLKSKKSSRFLSFITLLSILGVMLGVTALVVVLNVMEGFEGELKRRLLQNDLHILVMPSSNAGYSPTDSDSARYLDVLSRSEWIPPGEKKNPFKAIWPVISTEGILKFGGKVFGISLKGVGEEKLENLKPKLIETSEEFNLFEDREGTRVRLPGVFIGKDLAYELDLIPGSQITLISPTETEGPLSSVPRFKKFVVEGIYSTEDAEKELQNVYTPKENVYSFLRKKNVINEWEISVSDFDQAPLWAGFLREKLPGFHVSDWQQMNSSLLASLKLERLGMFLILAPIVIVASFNIVTMLMMMVLEKKKEIAILKAMGAQRTQVAAAFLAEGVLIGAIGVGMGLLLAYGISYFLKNYPIIQLPDIYYDRTIPVIFDPLYYLGVAGCAFAIVLLACLFPSRKAAKLSPLDGIREGIGNA